MSPLRPRGATVIALALTWSVTASAQLSAYDGDAGAYAITPPSDPHSFTTILSAFPAADTRITYGYPLASRLLAATGQTVFLQQTFGESTWLPVAVLAASDPYMDPAFLALSESGETIALGVGLEKPLYIFPASALSVGSPDVLTTDPNAKRYDDLRYYSAAFRGNRYLFIDAGGAEVGESYVYVVDTQAAVETILPILGNIPGASAGIAFDSAGDLVTGIGWDADDSRTGEIKIFASALIDAALAAGSLDGGIALDDGGIPLDDAGTPLSPIDYDSAGAVLATGILSADSLGFDASGDLLVGGGDVFGTSGHYGYAQIIGANVVSRVLGGGAPADSSNPNDVTTIEPDPCHNDDWTGITFVPGVDMVLVTDDPATMPPSCATVDTTSTSPANVYFPPNAPSTNGIPNGVNPGFETQEFYGAAELSRLVDALDSSTGGTNFDATVDYDANGTIDDADFAFLSAHWALPITN
jgi:hypothetical protein